MQTLLNTETDGEDESSSSISRLFCDELFWNSDYYVSLSSTLFIIIVKSNNQWKPLKTWSSQIKAKQIELNWLDWMNETEAVEVNEQQNEPRNDKEW